MGAKQSIEVENKAAGTKLAISRLSDEYLSFVEATTAEVSERASEVLKTGPLGDFSPLLPLCETLFFCMR